MSRLFAILPLVAAVTLVVIIGAIMTGCAREQNRVVAPCSGAALICVPI